MRCLGFRYVEPLLAVGVRLNRFSFYDMRRLHNGWWVAICTHYYVF